MQTTFLSDRQRHIVPVHWDNSTKNPYSYTNEALVIVTIQTAYRTISAIPCWERRLSTVGETFWSLAHRSAPPLEYQPVHVEFQHEREPALEFELLAPVSGDAKVLLAETPEPWPDSIEGWVRDVAGQKVCVPLVPRLTLGAPSSEGLCVVRSYALHRGKAVLRLGVNEYARSGNTLGIPKVQVEWGAFESIVSLDSTERDPRTEIDP